MQLEQADLKSLVEGKGGVSLEHFKEKSPDQLIEKIKEYKGVIKKLGPLYFNGTRHCAYAIVVKPPKKAPVPEPVDEQIKVSDQ